MNLGEFSDKATQSEIQELQGTIQSSQDGQTDDSLLKDLLSKVPEGLFGDKDEAGKADELQVSTVCSMGSKRWNNIIIGACASRSNAEYPHQSSRA